MTSQAISTKKRTVMSAFQVTQSSAQWLTTAYLLVVGLMIPLSAWIFESFNLRQNYLTMIGIFFVGSLICVFAPNFGILLTGRIIEAVAAGGLYYRLGIKKLSLFGFGMLILGTLPMLMFNTTTSLLVIGISYAVRMVGISFTMMTTFTAAINAVQSDLTAHANAASSTLRQVGGSFGTAISMLIVTLTITLQSRMPHQIALEH